jgi:hypothetical protein
MVLNEAKTLESSSLRFLVSISLGGDQNPMARSQARSLLMRFEKFKEVILDFKGIESIGPAFADEIFRVFANEHPEISLAYVSANEEVEKMILRAKSHEKNKSS